MAHSSYLRHTNLHFSKPIANLCDFFKLAKQILFRPGFIQIQVNVNGLCRALAVL